MQAVIERLRKTSGPALTIALFSAVFGLGLAVFSLSGSITVSALCMALSSVATALAARELIGRPDANHIKAVTQEETRAVQRKVSDLSDRMIEIEAEMRHMMSDRTTPDRLRLDVMTRDIERISAILSDLTLIVDTQESRTDSNPALTASDKQSSAEERPRSPKPIAASTSVLYKPANALAALQMENMLREDILGGKMKVHLNDVMNIETHRVTFRQVSCTIEGRLAEIHTDQDLRQAKISPGIVQLFDRMRFGFAFEFANQFGTHSGSLPILCPLMDATFGNQNAANEIVTAIEKHRELSRHLILALDHMILSRPTPGEERLLRRLQIAGTPLASMLTAEIPIDPDLLFQRGVRFALADADLLLGRSHSALRSAIHPSDLASYLARQEITLIVQGVETLSDVKALKSIGVIYATGPVFSQSQVLDPNAPGQRAPHMADQRIAMIEPPIKPSGETRASDMHVAPLRERLRRVRT